MKQPERDDAPKARAHNRLMVMLVASAPLVACSGAINGNDSHSPEPSEGGGMSPGGPRPPGPAAGPGPTGSETPAPAPLPASADLRGLKPTGAEGPGSLMLRGLTRAEYNNTVAALLGETSAPAARWGAEVKGRSGFLEPRPVSTKETREYMDAATDIAERAKAKLDKLLGCSPSAEEACAKSFVTAFGRKAFRRPLLPAEEADYLAFWNEARKTHGLSFVDATGLVIEAMLQSPSFMYHWQLGPTPPKVVKSAAGQAVALTAHELAARLSYFLTQAPPDELLSAAADSGKIVEAATLKEHAARLMGSDKAKELLQDFVAQLLDVSEFGESDDGVQRSLDRSRRAFVDAAMWTGKGTPDELLLGTELYVDATSAKLYGTTGVTSETPVAKVIDPAKRFGLLTHADFLGKTGKGNDSLPPRRGHAIWENLLCGDLPSDVPPTPPEIPRDPADTMREHFEKKVEVVACASACHQIVDNAGFAFENYGGPTWRDKDAANGKTINASGTLKMPFGGSLAFDGPRSFVEGMARSEELKQCFTRQMFRMASGRTEVAADGVALKALYEGFQGSAHDLKRLATAIVGTRAFAFRHLNAEETAQ